MDEGNEDHSVDVSQCVTRLREQRVNMVQSVVRMYVLYSDQFVDKFQYAKKLRKKRLNMVQSVYLTDVQSCT